MSNTGCTYVLVPGGHICFLLQCVRSWLLVMIPFFFSKRRDRRRVLIQWKSVILKGGPDTYYSIQRETWVVFVHFSFVQSGVFHFMCHYTQGLYVFQLGCLWRESGVCWHTCDDGYLAVVLMKVSCLRKLLFLSTFHPINWSSSW